MEARAEFKLVSVVSRVLSVEGAGEREGYIQNHAKIGSVVSL